MTIAALLKNEGYTTGQFGKNHLGDSINMLPTNHGFDEFYATLPPECGRRAEMYDYFPRRVRQRDETVKPVASSTASQPMSMTQPSSRGGAKSVSRRLRTPGPLNVERMLTRRRLC